VRKYLRLKTLPEPQKRPGRKSKLDPFKPYILEKLEEGPYTAARLYREIEEAHLVHARLSKSLMGSNLQEKHQFTV
jgi:transposase